MAEIVGTKELSEITGLSEGQIRALARNGLPTHRVGACLAFEVKEALAWLDGAGMFDSEEEDESEDEDEGDVDGDDEDAEESEDDENAD